MNFDVKRAKDYIKTIDLRETPRVLLPLALTTEPGEIYEETAAQIQVVGSTVFVFAAGVTPEIREAIGDSALLAQLVANKVAPASTPIGWFKAYGEVLQNLGWTLQANEWNDYTEKGKAVEVHDKVVEVMAAALAPEPVVLDTLRATIKLLKEMEPETPYLGIFNREARKAKTAHFQFIHVEKAPGGEPVLLLLGCAIDAPEPIREVLFFKCKEPKVKFQAKDERVQIDIPALLELAPLIRAKIRPYQPDYVSPLKNL